LAIYGTKLNEFDPHVFPQGVLVKCLGWGWYFPGSQCVPSMFPLSSQWVPIRFGVWGWYFPGSQCVLTMFLLSSQWVPIRLGVWGWYFPGSQCVLTMFPLSSQWVPIWISPCPQVPNVFPNMFSIALHLYRICFGKCCPPFMYKGGPKGNELYISK